jgi:hypothetical protein
VASAWTGIDAIKALAAEHAVIVYDRRECGQSHGRVERLSWASYTRQGEGAARSSQDGFGLDHGRMHGLLGRAGVRRSLSKVTRALLLPWPVGGYRWKVNSRERFLRHVNFTKQNGLKVSSTGRKAEIVFGWTPKPVPGLP